MFAMASNVAKRTQLASRPSASFFYGLSFFVAPSREALSPPLGCSTSIRPPVLEKKRLVSALTEVLVHAVINSCAMDVHAANRPGRTERKKKKKIYFYPLLFTHRVLLRL